MKRDPYNPQIPKRYDGQCVPGWLYPTFMVRVTITIKPNTIKRTGRGYNAWYLPQWYELDYQTPYDNTVRAITEMLFDSRVIPCNDNQRIVVYCQEWLDRVVIQLSKNNDHPHQLDSSYVEVNTFKPSALPSKLLLSLISHV